MPAPALDQLAVLGPLSRIVVITWGARRAPESHLMSSDDRLDLEFAYTTYRDSCQDLYSPEVPVPPAGGTRAPTPPASEPSGCAGSRTSSRRATIIDGQTHSPRHRRPRRAHPHGRAARHPAVHQDQQRQQPAALRRGGRTASRFGEIVVQGGVTSAILNAVVAEELPGPGTVFLNVSWDFRAPVRPGTPSPAGSRCWRRGRTSRSPRCARPWSATTERSCSRAPPSPTPCRSATVDDRRPSRLTGKDL